MKTPFVAIIGLPNSGKSTLFNKILHRHTALIHGEAGTTRDRAYAMTEWNGLSFYLIDTAGIINRPDSELEQNVQKQTAIAAEEADLIIFVVDGRTPVSDKDFMVTQMLRRHKKPTLLGINKIDARNQKTAAGIENYQKLGLASYAMSAVNGSGVGDLLDAITENLKGFQTTQIEEPDRIKIAFLGKPNVGKSSLINALLKQERLLVHHTAGTTRSTVEIPFTSTIMTSADVSKEQKFLLLDTAGIKRKWKQDADVEAAAAFQSIKTLSQTDIALFVLDASFPATVQDQIIGSDILKQHKPVVILLNKTDKLTQAERDKLLDTLPDYLPQLWFAPILFTSTENSQGIDKILQFASDAYGKADIEISTQELDKFLDNILREHAPGKIEDQRAPKLYNLKQTGTRPPVFRLTVNFPAAIADSWKRWFEKQFRLKFGYEGTPILIKYARK